MRGVGGALELVRVDIVVVVVVVGLLLSDECLIGLVVLGLEL